MFFFSIPIWKDHQWQFAFIWQCQQWIFTELPQDDASSPILCHDMVSRDLDYLDIPQNITLHVWHSTHWLMSRKLASILDAWARHMQTRCGLIAHPGAVALQVLLLPHWPVFCWPVSALWPPCWGFPVCQSRPVVSARWGHTLAQGSPENFSGIRWMATTPSLMMSEF